MNRIILFTLLLFPSPGFGQQNSDAEQPRIDSLNQIINNPKTDDAALASAYVALSNILYTSNPDTVIPLCINAKEIAERNLALGKRNTSLDKKFLTPLAGALNNLGYIYDDRGDISKALEYYHQSLKIKEEIGNKVGIATSINNIGMLYKEQGDITKALEYYHRSLKIRQELGNSPEPSIAKLGKKGIASSLNNIGVLYENYGDPACIGNKEECLRAGMKKALEFYHRCLEIDEEQGNKRGIATSLNNIGAVYKKQGDPNCNASKKECIRAGIIKALEYFYQSLAIREEIDFKKGIAISLSNIGNIELGRASDAATADRQVALERARKSGSRGLEVAREIGSANLMSFNANLLCNVAKEQGDFKEALEMYELHIQMRDSIKNEETQKATIRQQTKYEFEKAMLVKEQEEKEAARVLAEQTSRRDNLQYSIIIIVIVILSLSLLSVRPLGAVRPMIAEGLIFFVFLILFEFILVLADPYIDSWSGGAPGIKLLFNAGIAALIFPLHAFFEAKLKNNLSEQTSRY